MPKIKINEEEVDIRYSNWVSTLIDMIKPKNLFLYGGRGMAKTQDIIAKRSIDIVDDLPGGVFSFICDTYVNGLTNILPNLCEGWERNKFYEKFHYVCHEKPIPLWLKNQPMILKEWKHTISTYNGCIFLIKSLDRPSMNAGISVIHRLGDEVKYFNFSGLKKSNPTLRGSTIRFGHSPYFRGNTFCSDVANPADGEYDWMNKMQKLMDPELIWNIFQAGMNINDLEWELYVAEQNNKSIHVRQNIQHNIDKWKERFNKARRRNSTFYYVVSSLANMDILTFEYILDQKDSASSYEEFKTAILSCNPSIERGMRFYPNLKDDHFYKDGYNYDYYDQFAIKDNISQSCLGLKYLNKSKPLEAGYDAGNMHSLVILQDQGQILRALKDMYVLAPDWNDKLGRDFVRFFGPHNYKVLDLYYDRAANQYRSVGRDMATQLKNAIEKDGAGASTGWRVNLMSIGQGDITHQDEYDVMSAVMGGRQKGLPELKIDYYECKELRSSLEMAEAKIVIAKNGRKMIQKVKTSEKRKLSELPMKSTNMSDALKYGVCRKRIINMVKHRVTESFGDVTTN